MDADELVHVPFSPCRQDHTVEPLPVVFLPQLQAVVVEEKLREVEELWDQLLDVRSVLCVNQVYKCLNDERIGRYARVCARACACVCIRITDARMGSAIAECWYRTLPVDAKGASSATMLLRRQLKTQITNAEQQCDSTMVLIRQQREEMS